jgi:acyl-homoserine lactone acylase PvdQ
MRACVVVAVLLALAPAASAATRLNVIPHGQRAPGVTWGDAPGILPIDAQARMYDRLTPLFRNVTDAQLVPSADGSGYFKSADLLPEDDPSFVLSQTVSGISPSAGPVSARIKRDPYGVPHIYSDTDAGVIFGDGYAEASDQSVLLGLARDNGVAALLGIPGVPAIDLILNRYSFTPSAKVVRQMTRLQTRNIRAQGAAGRKLLDDIDTYLAGMNARRAEADYATTLPYTRTDIYALNAVKAQYLGEGGGGEVRNALFLDALRSRFGRRAGNGVFSDLQARNDPEAAVTTAKRFPAQTDVSVAHPRGMVRLENGSFTDTSIRLPGATRRVAPGSPEASNVLIVSGRRSATGAPLFVGGPQIGYNYPGLTMEVQLSSPHINVRGATSPPFPGYVLIGEGADYVWSLTSARADIIDTYAETLCGGSRHRYRYKGRCRKMTRVDAGTISKGSDEVRVVYWRSVHGPVRGYATDRSTGRRVALTAKRSSYGRETTDLLFNQRLTYGEVRSAKDFIAAAAQTPQTFNSFYANKTESAFFTAGRLPRRPRGVNPTLPVRGTGRFDWRGHLPASAHPQVIDPPSGEIVNWNNKPARDFPAGDDRFGEEGGIQRQTLLTSELGRFGGKVTLANVLAAANAAATEDVRVNRLWPTVRAMLAKAPAPDALSAQMARVLDAWHDAGASRVDSDLDGRIDDPGAPIIDAAWDGLANAALCGRLGAELCAQLATIISRFEAPPDHNQYAGWHQYMWKDLRTILGQGVRGRYSTRYCGRGNAKRCATALWAALSAAGKKLAAAQGPDPQAWRKPTDYIQFSPLTLHRMQYTNRPSGIHQVMTYGP